MKRWKNKRGQGLIEYILIICVMGVAAIVVVQQLSETTKDGFNRASTELAEALGG